MAPKHRFPELRHGYRAVNSTHFRDPDAEICVEASPRGPSIEMRRRHSEDGNKLRWWDRLSDATKLCLVTGIAALAVSFIGALINPFVANPFQATGMAFVGLFYLIMFATNLPPRGLSAVGAKELLKPEKSKAESNH